MPHATVRLGHADGALAAALAGIRDELEVVAEFPPEVEAEARTVLAKPLPAETALLDLPFFTIDPADSLDLDQAMCLQRDGDGYLVWYAIADVARFVTPGGAIDRETRERGQTLYAPDGRVPLHPTSISEQAASLLPGVERSAYVWAFRLDAAARVTETGLSRARIRSRERLDYHQVQKHLDGGDEHPSSADQLALVREVGVKRERIEAERGGASLGRPDQEVVEEDGRYSLVRRTPLPAEGWNAQISLMTGMAAADIMLKGGVGILRTMPAPDAEAIDTFRRQARALGHPWPTDVDYGSYLRALDAADSRQLAILHAAASLFRGAGYTAFDGEPPAETVQSAVAAPYAHATAPLRRLVDRFTLVVCEALANGRVVPQWARGALPELPALMAASDNRAGRLDRAAFNAVEAAVLRTRVGEVFEATVVRAKKGGGDIQLDELAVTARCEGDVAAGDEILARLVTADIASGTVLFQAEGAAPAR